jgi:hypothetical protein
MFGKYRLPSGNAGRPNVSYYDFALAVLPVPLLVGLLAGKILSLSTQTGISAGAVLSALLLGHLLFGDPPTRRGPRRGPRDGDGSVGAGEPSA